MCVFAENCKPKVVMVNTSKGEIYLFVDKILHITHPTYTPLHDAVWIVYLTDKTKFHLKKSEFEKLMKALKD